MVLFVCLLAVWYCCTGAGDMDEGAAVHLHGALLRVLQGGPLCPDRSRSFDRSRRLVRLLLHV